MAVDNFELIRSKLTFVDQFDRYVCHIMRRAKDQASNSLGSNESQRLLRTYYFGDLEYFDSKIQAIKELCETNNARAYILPQVRNNRDCLINLGKLVFENLDNPTIKLDGIVRKAVCSCHSSRDKRWILDFDDDTLDLFEPVYQDVVKNVCEIRGITEDQIGDYVYVVPTKHGKHVVTVPFDTKKINELHPMVFQNDKTGYDITQLKALAPDYEKLVFANQRDIEEALGDNSKLLRKKRIVGLLKKDSPTILYIP